VTTASSLAFWLRDRSVVARMKINMCERTQHLETLISSRRTVDAGALTDPDTPLDLLAGGWLRETDRRT
jgi:hypothetical protein